MDVANGESSPEPVAEFFRLKNAEDDEALSPAVSARMRLSLTRGERKEMRGLKRDYAMDREIHLGLHLQTDAWWLAKERDGEWITDTAMT